MKKVIVNLALVKIQLLPYRYTESLQGVGIDVVQLWPSSLRNVSELLPKLQDEARGHAAQIHIYQLTDTEVLN